MIWNTVLVFEVTVNVALGGLFAFVAPAGQVFTLKLAFSLAASRGAAPSGSEIMPQSDPSSLGVVQSIPVVPSMPPSMAPSMTAPTMAAPSMPGFQPAVAQSAFPTVVGSFMPNPYSTAGQ